MKVGYDVDGTVAEYGGSASYRVGKIGRPLPRLSSVKEDIRAGHDVWWFTTRAGNSIDRATLREWSQEHLGKVLPMTQNPAGFDVIYDAKIPGGKLDMTRLDAEAKLKKYRARPDRPGKGAEMPFESAKQERMFRAAKHDPEVRKRHGLSVSTVEKMIAEDKKAMPGMDGIAILIKKKSPAEMERGEVQAMLLDLAKAQIKAIKEDDAPRLAEARQLEHDLLCDLHRANAESYEEPEEPED